VQTVKIPWDDIPLGVETGRVEIAVTDAVIDSYLVSMDLDIAWFTTGAPPYGTRIAPPDMVPKLAMEPLFQDYLHDNIGPNIRAKQAFKFFAPVMVGTTVRGVGHLVEKYERRGRRFVTLEGLFTDAAGRHLVLDRRTQMLLSDDFNMRS
jgi:acyl dehydratase